MWLLPIPSAVLLGLVIAIGPGVTPPVCGAERAPGQDSLTPAERQRLREEFLRQPDRTPDSRPRP